MRRIITYLFFTLTCFGGAVAEDVPVKTVETIQKSVIPILCMKPTSDGTAQVTKVLGTGFFINREGYFLTAAHVVLGLNAICPRDSIWAIFAPTVPWKTRGKITTHWFAFVNCQYNEGTDVAICKTVKNPFSEVAVNKNIQPVRFGTFATHGDGSAVAFTGFPLESIVPITSKGFVATYFIREDWFGIDKTGWPGASGSPVYNQRGEVIGIIIKRGANEGTGLSFARPIDSILQFVAREKVLIEK